MAVNMNKQELYQRALEVLPNVPHLRHSKFYAQYGDGFPQFYSRAKGCKIWDVEGKEYIDYNCAWGANILGYANPEVDNAVAMQRNTGLDTGTGPSPKMVDTAEKLVGMTPGMEWCIFAKNGTDVTALALTVARAATKKRYAIVEPKGYHGGDNVWASGRPGVREWPGVLPTDTAYQLHYEYNNLSSVVEAASKSTSLSLQILYILTHVLI